MKPVETNSVHKIMDGRPRLFKRPESLWHVRFSVNGSQRKKSTQTENLKEARKVGAEIYLDAVSGKSSQNTKFKRVASTFLNHYQSLVHMGEKLEQDYMLERHYYHANLERKAKKLQLGD